MVRIFWILPMDLIMLVLRIERLSPLQRGSPNGSTEAMRDGARRGYAFCLGFDRKG